jgi:adenylate kinase family enzyme
MRLHVTGNAGSGKSTFARLAGSVLGINVFGLDTIVWRERWRKTAQEERNRLEEGLVAKDEWVIEGVSAIARRTADIVILLDLPRSLCYMRCASRNWRYLFRSRPGLPGNCPEFRIIPRLIKIIWRFPRGVRPKIIRDLEPKKLIRLSSQREINQFLNELSHHQSFESSRPGRPLPHTPVFPVISTNSC